MSTNHTCKYFGKCGGCQTPNLTYDEQLSMKMRKMISAVGKRCRVDEIVAMSDPTHYRTKIQAAFMRMGDSVQCGIYQSGSGRVIPAKSCLLEDEAAQKIRRTVEKLAHSMRLTVYNPKNGRGLLRHVMIRTSRATGQAMVTLVTGTSPFTKAEAFVDALVSACPDVTTIVQSVNETDIPLWLGGKQAVLFGDGVIEEQICGARFLVSPKAFLQVNPTQTEKLYSLAMEGAALTGKETVLDAYCGVGTMAIIAAKNAAKVTGVEIVEDAVADARRNAALNGVKNADFIAADAAEYMQKLARNKKTPDVVILDPPRAGCERKLLTALTHLAPKRIVYVSCNPDTLGRDVNTLCKGGYKVTRVTPVDMFPFTTHIESVVCLSREKADDYIRISVQTKDLKTKAN
ncbi:MAG: 23S rRNA (uracil(1939)-C(5))-methyltransferase RlmD [Ruminococcaceae bacterium]|nr:23S rRNA (uracil(1939)-C(5))-methyltransferase RlmD [Oscillospiraceae bacterium]